MNKWTGKKIRSLRKSLDLTQAEFGKLLGVSGNYVYMLEAEDRAPSRPLQILLDHLKKERR